MLDAFNGPARGASSEPRGATIPPDEAELSGEVIRDYLIAAGFDLEDIERRRLGRLRRWALS